MWYVLLQRTQAKPPPMNMSERTPTEQQHDRVSSSPRHPEAAAAHVLANMTVTD